MRHRINHRKLGRTSSHRRALLRSLATSLIKHERIETTLPKVKELRSVAEKLITLGKEGTLHARRQAAAYILSSDEALKKLFTTLAERFKDRSGGYTRIFKFPHRKGDSAEMATIEYLGYVPPAPKKKTEEHDHDHEETKKPAKKAKEEKVKKEKPAKKEKAPKAEKKPAKAAKKTSEKVEKEDKKGGLKGLFGRKKKTEK